MTTGHPPVIVNVVQHILPSHPMRAQPVETLLQSTGRQAVVVDKQIALLQRDGHGGAVLIIRINIP